MRVLSIGNVYPPHSLGGYEIVWRGVTEELRARGHTARVVTTGYRRPAVPQSAPEDLDVHRELRWYWRDHDWPRVGLRERLALERHNADVFDRHLRELQPDVLAWWPMGGMSLSLIERGRRAGVPAVLFVHDYWLRYAPLRDRWTRMWSRLPLAPLAGFGERATGIPARYDLGAAGRWLVNSGFVLDDTLAAGLNIPSDQLCVLSPGIEERLAAAARAAVSARDGEAPGSSASGKGWAWRLLYLGRVVEQKGVHTAIEALAHLPGEAELRVVGDGHEPYLRRLRALAERLELARRVTFEGALPREATFDALRRADTLVFPVIWAEPWGLVPLEAMALGIPVVATGRGGSGDFLRHEVNSLLFEPRDAPGLAAALRRLADDPDLRDSLRQEGYRTAAARGEAEFNRRAVEELEEAAGRWLRPS
jgi:glycosyltransferase involved in cell wall biosynthesis